MVKRISEKPNFAAGLQNAGGEIDYPALLRAPSMTTTQRDALTPVNGMIIYNSTLNRHQVRRNGAWNSIIDGADTIDNATMWRGVTLSTALAAPSDLDFPRFSSSTGFWELTQIGPAWTSWTPTLKQGVSTNIAKTINYAKYLTIGKLVICEVRIAPTAAGTAGSDVQLTVPVAEATSTTFPVGSGSLTLGANKLKVIVLLNGGSGVFTFRRVDDATTTSNAGTSPSVAVANSGDLLFFHAMYEAA